VRKIVDLPPPDPDEVAAQASAGIDLARLGLTYEFRVERRGGDVIMTGMVPDEAVRGVLVDAARERFAGGNVDDNLVVNAAAPADFISAARQAITIAGLVTSGATGIRGRALYVEGLTASDRDLERLRDTINDALPPGYDAQLQVGSRQSLAAMMRENPDLAARVGPLPGGSADAGRIDLGITRALDRSPEAAARCQSKIDNLMSTRAIGFDTGSSDISEDSRGLLDELVALAKSCPDTRIEIGGHTDDLGTEENNLALSQRRAESVMEYFVKNGIKLGRLSAVGYGESQPRVANRTAADRARNRRIEFRVL
jgi:OOP family OmpA-OmpF porin